MISPVHNPRISSPYGYRVLEGVKQFHDGIDFVSISDDAEVFSIFPGKIIYDQDDYIHALRMKDKHHSAGNMVIVSSSIGNKIYHVRYLHLAKNIVSKGDEIEEGKILGYYGNVGYSFGAHLHVDVYNFKWEKINPALIMQEVIKNAA